MTASGGEGRRTPTVRQPGSIGRAQPEERGIMKVTEAMTQDPLSVLAEGTICEAAAGLRDAGIGALPVVSDEKQLIGMITDRDIAVRAVADGQPPETLVQNVMTDALVYAEASFDVKDALALMGLHQVRRLPVLEGPRLVGVISQADVAAIARPRQLAETMRLLSEPASSRAGSRTGGRAWARLRLA
jgi:CBS domain-containing protein